ncbi:MAG TPA: hypothetical protein VN445_11615 [Rectinemataceae bacterium]|nr:hypothetical protein [Rectinemataceae bacterium]
MSEALRLDVHCPLCGGRLIAEFSYYYTEARCESCMVQIGWPAALVHSKGHLELMLSGKSPAEGVHDAGAH